MKAEVAEFARVVRYAILIPRGTPPSVCRGPRCNNHRVYFVGKRIVSVEQYGVNPPGIEPTETEDGIGIDHHADCPDRSMFKSKAKRK